MLKNCEKLSHGKSFLFFLAKMAVFLCVRECSHRSLLTICLHCYKGRAVTNVKTVLNVIRRCLLEGISKADWLHTDICHDIRGCLNDVTDLVIKVIKHLGHQQVRTKLSMFFICLILFTPHSNNECQIEKCVSVFRYPIHEAVQKHLGLARQTLLFLCCLWSCLTNLISKDTNIVFLASIHHRALDKRKYLMIIFFLFIIKTICCDPSFEPSR